MIKYYHIDDELRKLNNMIPIRIKYLGDLQTVYIERVTNTAIWGRHYAQAQPIKLHPNRNVEIIKIGANIVQTKEEFKQEKEDYYDALSCLYKERKQQTYKDAYRHSKKVSNYNE